MAIAESRVFVIEYHRRDGGAERVVKKCMGGQVEYIGQEPGLLPLSSPCPDAPAPEQDLTGDIFERSGIIKTVLL